MRLIPIFIMSLFLFSCREKKINIKSSGSDYYAVPKAYENIYGNIKQIIETNYFIHEQSNKIMKDSMNWQNTFSFNDAGKETQIVALYGDGSLHWKAINTYNERGQLARVNYYNSDGDLRYIFKYYYDANGALTEFDDFTGADFKTKTSTKYEYKGDSIEITHYGLLDKFDHNTILKKDTHGNIGEVIGFQHDGNLWFRNFFKYNEAGDEIMDSCFTSHNSSMILKSVYSNIDREGNWVNKVIYQNNEPLGMTTREIEYY